MEVDPCTIDGPWPCDDVRISHERGTDGEPTGWVTIEGLRQGGARAVRVSYERLWEQMAIHAGSHHGMSVADPMDAEGVTHMTL